MKKNKLILKYLFSVIAVILIVAVCSEICCHPSVEIEDTVNGYYVEDENSLDYVVVGSSGSNKAVLPALIWNQSGLIGYNYSICTASGNLYLSILKEALSKQKNPILIVDIDGFLVPDSYHTNKDSIRMWCDSMPKNRNWYETVNLWVKDNKFERYFPFCRYHRYMTSLVGYIPITINEYKQRWHFISDPRKGSTLLNGNDSSSDMWELQINDHEIEKPENLSYSLFLDFIKYLKSQNIKDVIFVNFPKSSFTENDKKRNTTYCHRFNYLKEDFEKSGYKYIDLCRPEAGLQLTKDDFADSAHVSKTGAIKVSKFLAEYLHTNYKPKEKSESLQQSWNSDYTALVDLLK